MAAARRDPPTSLIQRIGDDAAAFDFVQAVRLIELADCQGTGPDGEARRRTGEDALPADEAVRFVAAPDLRFPAAEILKAERPDGGKAPTRLTVSFMGLTGPLGVLPRFYTEFMVRNLHRRHFALRDFLDVIHHRLIALFYRAATKYRLPLAFERAGGPEDSFSTVLRALVGMATPHLRRRLPVADGALLYYAGHFARWPRSAVALGQMLSHMFGQTVGVRQFRGQWLKIAAGEQTRLPGAAVPDGQFCVLGMNAVVGERTWEMQGGFRIEVGPLRYAGFHRFMPGGDDFGRLLGLTRAFVGPGFDFDVQLTLDRADIPRLRLGGEQPPEGGPRLGWNTWLRRDVEPADRSDPIFRGS